MCEDPAEAHRPPLSAEVRRRLRNEAVHAVQRLSEALNENSDSEADARALVARLHAAVEPLRGAVALSNDGALNVGIGGSLTVTGTAGLASQAGFGGNGSVTVEHILQIDDTMQLQEATAPLIRVSTKRGTSWNVEAAGEPDWRPTADDVPWLLWQMLLRLDDLANPTKPGLTVGQVHDRAIALLGLLAAVLGLLK